jgi:hypothetical protein
LIEKCLFLQGSVLTYLVLLDFILLDAGGRLLWNVALCVTIFSLCYCAVGRSKTVTIG